MKIKNTIFILLMTFSMPSLVNAQVKKTIDYLNVPVPIVFDKQAYSLSWSAHPAADFYKQEYLVKGVDPDKYKTMILVDVITGEPDLKKVAGAKLEELKKMKLQNPVVNYEIIQNPKTGEYIIDFLLSANAADGSMSIVERNVYRYKTFTDKAGQQGILLLGVSTRGYGPEIDKFFASLKLNKADLVKKVLQFNMPQIKI